jgi:hypothetical protein
MTLVLSYIPKEKEEYTSPYYDDSVYLLERRVPPPYAIIETNKAAVDKADFVVSGVKYSFGGAAQAVFVKNVNGEQKTVLSDFWNPAEKAFTLVTLNTGDTMANCLRFFVNTASIGGKDLPSAVAFMKTLDELDKADGKAYFKFDVKVDETYVNGTANQRRFYFWMRRQTSSLKQVGPSAEAANIKANTWTTYYLEADELLEYYHHETDYLNYFQFTVYGPAGSTISIRNLKAVSVSEYEANS